MDIARVLVTLRTENNQKLTVDTIDAMNAYYRKRQAGFTLVELMIVVAIIGLLATIAVPFYQDYVAKSKFGAALAEVSAGKIPLNLAMLDGTPPATLDDINILAATTNCAMSLRPSGTGLECAIEGGPSTIADKTITLERDATGVWTCSSDALAQHRGPACGAAAD